MYQNCQQYSLPRSFLFPQAQGFEKQVSMIALSSAVVYFSYTVESLTNAVSKLTLSQPALMLLFLVV